MNRHEGVSCDSCLKSNFSGKRYKCLICYDFDLCSSCYENGNLTRPSRHIESHPMQCILTKKDYELYYGGETLQNNDRPQSLTCPFCSKMGFNETTLKEHVFSEHSNTTQEVICPICASLPGGEANYMTDDFGGHLILEHRTETNDLLSFIDNVSARNENVVRRYPQIANLMVGRTRTAQSARIRRAAMHFGSLGLTGHPVPSTHPQTETDNRDPITDLLSQLSNIRRTTSNTSNAAQGHGQFHQIQVQLQLERQHVINRQLELVPRVPQRTLREFSFPTIENVRHSNTHSQFTNKTQIVKVQNPKIERKLLLDSLKCDCNVFKNNEHETYKEYAEEIFLATTRKAKNKNS